MKRGILFFSFVIISLGAGSAFTQSVEPDNKRACPFEISGMWRSEATTVSVPFFFSFSPEGHVTLMSHSTDSLPQDFEVITSVNYKLDSPKSPKGIDFVAIRGNDIFPRGVTSLKILEYSDDSFTSFDPATDQKTQWTRERTQRYFLTFAARRDTVKQGGAAFAMWTILDGRDPRKEALGVQVAGDPEGKTRPVFGPIPSEVYDQVTEAAQKDKKTKEDIVIVRFELTPAEFEATYKTYQEWDQNAKTGALPALDPYQNAVEFLRKATEGLNQCGAKTRLYRPATRDRDEVTTKHTPSLRPLELIRILRTKNEELNVPDSIFPWFWRPTLEAPVQ